MKVVPFANRLTRDLKERSLAELSADARQELLDAINKGLQSIWALTPGKDKITAISLTLQAPVTISITVTNGSDIYSGYAATPDVLYRTLRIGGDQADNQIVSDTRLLLPYSGPSGTISAVLYGDAIAIKDIYSAITRDPWNVDYREYLRKDDVHLPRYGWPSRFYLKPIDRPTAWWVEPNASDQNPSFNAVFRVNSLPDTTYRLQAEAALAPYRIKFTDLLDGNAEIPLRDEYVEAYLLPECRRNLVTSTLWRNKDAIAIVNQDGETALAKYSALVEQYASIPNNRVGIPYGY